MSCGSDDQPELGPTAPWSVSFRWDDTDPTVDLESPAVRSIRAAAESDQIEMGIGRDYTYPGYPEAAGPNGTVGGKIRMDDTADEIGTLYFKLVVRTASESSIDGVLCRDETGQSRDVDGHFPLPDPSRSLSLWAINVTAERADSPNDTPTTSPTIPQREPVMPEMTGPVGRTARPSGNVFGDWKITRYNGDFSTPTRQLCYPWVEQRWGGPTPPAPSRSDQEPPTIEPFYPGWQK
ncbi:hypothetical protein FK531_20345 [Rhodococcus spelaei]|uniref:Uncharacterized protein n=1 Tax=Rhodococcus spelaei TaxID=2546320 RepID=A0A541B0F6_9NOCA|nr:hypothetical protein [Rhodococcus spelaei]TQF65782.1 hypothetical protein FK531_20345 [Rhodococcus spelaei]